VFLHLEPALVFRQIGGDLVLPLQFPDSRFPLGGFTGQLDHSHEILLVLAQRAAALAQSLLRPVPVMSSLRDTLRMLGEIPGPLFEFPDLAGQRLQVRDLSPDKLVFRFPGLFGRQGALRGKFCLQRLLMLSGDVRPFEKYRLMFLPALPAMDLGIAQRLGASGTLEAFLERVDFRATYLCLGILDLGLRQFHEDLVNLMCLA
jgi:hypothetical protein